MIKFENLHIICFFFQRADYNLLLVTAPTVDNKLFRIRGDGQVKIFGSGGSNVGGLIVDGGGLTIYGNDGLYVDSGATIASGASLSSIVFLIFVLTYLF
jgi:hypothetical protein